MSYETGKKLATFGFIGRVLVYFIGVGLNVALLMSMNGADTLLAYNNVTGIVSTFNGIGYTITFGLAVLGFFFMFMDGRENILLITAATLGVSALPNFLSVFGIDISVQGLINNLALDGILAVIVYFALMILYNSYLVMFSAYSFKNGNPIFGIISLVFFLWHTVGSIVLTIIQSNINAYGIQSITQYATIMSLATAVIFIIESVFLIIHVAKSY